MRRRLTHLRVTFNVAVRRKIPFATYGNRTTVVIHYEDVILMIVQCYFYKTYITFDLMATQGYSRGRTAVEISNASHRLPASICVLLVHRECWDDDP